MEINNFRNHSLSYKIVEFYAGSGQIKIACDGLEGTLLIDLPIDNGKYLEGDELDNYIRGFVPTWHIERSENIKKGISNSDYILNLVEKEDTQDNQQKPIIDVNDFYAQRRVYLASSDWVMLEDSPYSEKKKQEWKEYRQSLRDMTKNQEITTDIIWPKMPDKGYN